MKLKFTAGKNINHTKYVICGLTCREVILRCQVLLEYILAGSGSEPTDKGKRCCGQGLYTLVHCTPYYAIKFLLLFFVLISELPAWCFDELDDLLTSTQTSVLPLENCTNIGILYCLQLLNPYSETI